jgi:hypothetical protein
MGLYIGIGMLVLGVLGAVLGLIFRGQARRILAAPFRMTGEVAREANGMASCQGAVRAVQPLAAPCSNRPCVHYHLKVEAKVKESQAGQTRVSWKTIADQHVGSSFYLDDGSGGVAVHTQERLEADLETAYAGPPPGGAGLGALAAILQPTSVGRGEIMGYKVTERIIGVDAPLFAMGQASGGHLTPPANGKLVVSTRGRDGLVGAKKRVAVIAMSVGALLAAGAIPIMILRPGEAKACGPMQDEVAACAIESREVTIDETQPDGSTKKVTLQQSVHEWNVTKGGSYELSAWQDSKKGKTFPRVQVEDAIGFPVNIGINWGLGSDSATSTSTSTKTLSPGKYKIYVWSDKGGPSRLLFKIVAADAARESKN